MEAHLQKWRLILGRAADEAGTVALGAGDAEMDRTVEALYESDRRGGLGSSSPQVSQWLEDVYAYFPKPMAKLMVQDALGQLGIRELLKEPELFRQVEPSVELVGLILSLKGAVPEQALEAARSLIRRLSEQLQQQLRVPMQQSIRGALTQVQSERRPRAEEVNWLRTIRKNLRHYQPEHKTIIPERLVGNRRLRRSLKQVVLLVDQSASMASSVVYAGILGGIMATVPSLQTAFIAFDTSVVDLSEQLDDPVELLFSMQLGGGTDIQQAMHYARRYLDRPADTTLVLLSDLFEGAPEELLVELVREYRQMGVQIIVLLALNDRGTPAYDEQLARRLAALGVPAFACTPQLFPGMMAAALGGDQLESWLAREGIARK